MNTVTTVDSFFSTSSMMQGMATIYSRTGSAPLPFNQTLINLNDLEQALQEEQSHNYLLALLSDEEQKLFSTFAYPKRRREWLGGRIAAKSAILQLLSIDTTPETFSALSILPAENGSPVSSSTMIAMDKLPALSISHSDRFAVAMATGAKSCGIDIQKISTKTERVADRFSEPDELLLLQEHAPQLSAKECLTLLWSSKEALKKALLHDQPIIFQGVVLNSLDIGKHFTLRLHFPGGDLSRPAEVTALMLEDCILAYTFAQHDHA